MYIITFLKAHQYLNSMLFCHHLYPAKEGCYIFYLNNVLTVLSYFYTFINPAEPTTSNLEGSVTNIMYQGRPQVDVLQCFIIMVLNNIFISYILNNPADSMFNMLPQSILLHAQAKRYCLSMLCPNSIYMLPLLTPCNTTSHLHIYQLLSMMSYQ